MAMIHSKLFSARLKTALTKRYSTELSRNWPWLYKISFGSHFLSIKQNGSIVSNDDELKRQLRQQPFKEEKQHQLVINTKPEIDIDSILKAAINKNRQALTTLFSSNPDYMRAREQANAAMKLASQEVRFLKQTCQQELIYSRELVTLSYIFERNYERAITNLDLEKKTYFDYVLTLCPSIDTNLAILHALNNNPTKANQLLEKLVSEFESAPTLDQAHNKGNFAIALHNLAITYLLLDKTIEANTAMQKAYQSSCAYRELIDNKPFIQEADHSERCYQPTC